jgi:hypothetical protein
MSIRAALGSRHSPPPVLQDGIYLTTMYSILFLHIAVAPFHHEQLTVHSRRGKDYLGRIFCTFEPHGPAAIGHVGVICNIIMPASCAVREIVNHLRHESLGLTAKDDVHKTRPSKRAVTEGLCKWSAK